MSDAEPGTGLGIETVNDLVPRDSSGRAYLPATHLKGLMREHLSFTQRARDWNAQLLNAVLGAEGNTQGAMCLSDARTKIDKKVRTISRTAINDHGTASAGSLRTTEAISVQTEFHGTIQFDPAADETVKLASLFALKLIDAVGGGRNRGAGACRIDIPDELRKPGELLCALDEMMKTWKFKSVAKSATATQLSETATVWFQLVFRADGPVCCPETPVVGINHLRSGISIPASAVQGAILTHLNGQDSAMASACFASSRFRCWPLLPASASVEPEEAEVPTAVRVTMTHRISKLPAQNKLHDFRDEAIDPYKWEDVASGSPLKGSDGVLLRYSNDEVKLWRSGEMPRMVTAHGVHAGGRNLFSVESLAVNTFSGMMAVPEEVAQILEAMFKKDPAISVGKSRTVRGGGRIELRRVEVTHFTKWHPSPRQVGQVFVVQSPLALPEGELAPCASDMLAQLVAASGLGEVSEAHATTQVLFGWNRADSDQSNSVAGTQRLKAVRTIAPGSVFVLENPVPVKDLPQVLLKGVGAGRERGFGAILPHPGIATHKYERTQQLRSVRSTNHAGRWALDLHQVSKEGGPSPSQIGALAAKAAQGVDLTKVVEYLGVQQQDRPARFADVWKPADDELTKLLKTDNKPLVCRALRAWQDLAIIHRENKRDNNEVTA